MNSSRDLPPSLRAKRSNPFLPRKGKERMDCFVASLLAMTTNTNPRSRGAIRPSCSYIIPPSKQRAQGMPGAWCARSRACRVVNTRVSHHGHTGNARHSPRNGFNSLFRALPGDRAFLPPSLANTSANLTPASGCQDHTTSPSAIAPFVKGALSVHRIPHPTSVTTAKRPSCGTGWPWI